MDRMVGKVVIITGASDGIGKETAMRIAREGAHVVLVARRPEPLEGAVADILEAGGSAECASVDVTNAASLESLIIRVAEERGRLDGLVNNAARVSNGLVEQISDDAWRDAFAGGVDAVFVATRTALRVMQPMRSGSIVNVSSVMGRRAAVGMAAYSASKAAIDQFTRVSAVEAAMHGMRVNVVAPGLILTPGTKAYFSSQPGEQHRQECAIPMRRGGLAVEVANAILFLLSDEASYVTGICLDVDGGKLARLG